MKIKKEETIALVIDVQEKLVPHMYLKEEIINNIDILVKGLDVLKVPTWYTQQYTKGLGMTVQEVILDEKKNSFEYMEKLSFSCGYDGELVRRLRQDGIKTIIISGMETHICVMQTVVDLIEAEFQVVLAYDCITSRKEEDRKNGFLRMQKEGAYMGTYESILFELTTIAGTEEFKRISKLVK